MSTLTITAPIALINASGLATAIHSSFCARVGSITTRESGRHNADASAAEAALTANMEKAAIVTETRPTNAHPSAAIIVIVNVGRIRVSIAALRTTFFAPRKTPARLSTRATNGALITMTLKEMRRSEEHTSDLQPL